MFGMKRRKRWRDRLERRETFVAQLDAAATLGLVVTFRPSQGGAWTVCEVWAPKTGVRAHGDAATCVGAFGVAMERMGQGEEAQA